MDYLTQDFDFFNSIKPRKFKLYVTSIGWSLVQDVGDKFYIYSKEQFGQLFIPKNMEASDYSRRVADAIMLLSKAEKKTLTSIVNEIFNPDSDIFRFRLTGAKYEDGTAPLTEGLNLFTSSKRSLYIAAMQVKRPSSFYKKLSNPEIDNFISACKIGQTERGSFIATLVCPLNIEGFETTLSMFDILEPSVQSFTRKVTENYFNSISSILSAIDNDNLDLLKNAEGEYSISSNFCTSLVEMQPEDSGGFLELSVSMSHNDFIPRLESKIKIERDYFSLIEQVGKSIRPIIENTEKLYFAKVKTLNGTADNENKMQGEVLVTFNGEDQLIKAKIELTPEDYLIADRAHIENKFVEIKGILEENPRVSKFSSMTSFRILG